MLYFNPVLLVMKMFKRSWNHSCKHIYQYVRKMKDANPTPNGEQFSTEVPTVPTDAKAVAGSRSESGNSL
jgi:hypothetical protein